MVLWLLVLSIVFSLGGVEVALKKPNPSGLQGCQTGQEVQMHGLTLMETMSHPGGRCAATTRDRDSRGAWDAWMERIFIVVGFCGQASPTSGLSRASPSSWSPPYQEWPSRSAQAGGSWSKRLLFSAVHTPIGHGTRHLARLVSSPLSCPLSQARGSPTGALALGCAAPSLSYSYSYVTPTQGSSHLLELW